MIPTVFYIWILFKFSKNSFIVFVSCGQITNVSSTLSKPIEVEIPLKCFDINQRDKKENKKHRSTKK